MRLGFHFVCWEKYWHALDGRTLRQPQKLTLCNLVLPDPNKQRISLKSYSPEDMYDHARTLNVCEECQLWMDMSKKSRNPQKMFRAMGYLVGILLLVLVMK